MRTAHLDVAQIRAEVLVPKHGEEAQRVGALQVDGFQNFCCIAGPSASPSQKGEEVDDGGELRDSRFHWQLAISQVNYQYSCGRD